MIVVAGEEGTYRNYVNTMSVNSLALNKAQHAEERDKKRQLSHKFRLASPSLIVCVFEFHVGCCCSLTPSSELRWNGAVFGSRNTVMATIRDNLLLMESRLPRNMLHPAWPQHRAEWEELVEASATPASFANVLSRLELVIKPVVFTHAWREALGEYFYTSQ